MSFSKAFERAGMKPTESQKTPKIEIDPEEVPMMYRAQVSGRCSLQFAGKKEDKQHLDKWSNQWVYPKSESNPQPRQQYQEPKLGLDGSFYRIKIDFPFRLSSNCGQDSVLRPIMGKNGIPYLSGSSVKGLFSRACSEQQRKLYCGEKINQDNSSSPSKIGLRFHGAYPIGDWSGMRKVKVKKKDGKTVEEIRYRMLDVIHPQQLRQVGDQSARDSASAYTMVSLYQPTMVFEFSSADPQNTNWKEVEWIFLQSIQLGVGGKTSTGYGLGGYNDDYHSVVSSSKISVALIGQGVSPTLRSDEPEFRPNLFKASLRGHIKRLLGGVTRENKCIDQEIDRLFGSSNDVGKLKVFWEQQKDVVYGDYGKTKTFRTEGILHLDAKNQEDIVFMENVLKFAFVMGGFGKSWRRASHQIFLKSYKEFEIGCQWELSRIDLKWLDIKSTQALKQFLEDLHGLCKGRLNPNSPEGYQPWRESWHPDRVTVYAKETRQSDVIALFHQNIFKKTEAIGGHITIKEYDRNTKEEKYKEQLKFSHIWHRMLPIGDEQYLEIVTIFHSDHDKWKHKKHQDDQEGQDQLKPFLDAIAAKGLEYVWGNKDPLKKPLKSSTPAPKSTTHQPPSSNQPIPKPKLRPK
ncbi:hypothetical protein [Pseudanabaena minima]|uniref:hypothetical protein n=1 Tax=Pseudanabaena minima TaxID=890415 RepID=UPI003DA8D32D